MLTVVNRKRLLALLALSLAVVIVGTQFAAANYCPPPCNRTCENLHNMNCCTVFCDHYTPGPGHGVTPCDTNCYGNPYDVECDGDCFGAIQDWDMNTGSQDDIAWN